VFAAYSLLMFVASRKPGAAKPQPRTQ